LSDIKKYKDTIIIDTDDIDDPNSLKAIKKYSFENEKKRFQMS
jgi:hypothetical protein